LLAVLWQLGRHRPFEHAEEHAQGIATPMAGITFDVERLMVDNQAKPVGIWRNAVKLEQSTFQRDIADGARQALLPPDPDPCMLRQFTAAELRLVLACNIVLCGHLLAPVHGKLEPKSIYLERTTFVPCAYDPWRIAKLENAEQSAPEFLVKKG
jgi:hypothetical protein